MAHRFLNKQLLLRESSNTLITSHGTSWGTFWRRISLLSGSAFAQLPCRWTVRLILSFAPNHCATVVEPATGPALIHKPTLLRQTMWLRVEVR